MSAYIKLSTLEYPRHEGDIRLEHPELNAVFVCPPTYAPVDWVEPPPYDTVLERVLEGAPELINDKWRMTWVVRAATQEELDYEVEANKLPPHLDTSQPGTAPDVVG